MERPHILLIVCHDLGTHLGCYGWDPLLQSPELDRLAGDGLRFARHFSTATFCSPSRGAIVTGKYPHTNGLMGLVNLGWDLPEGTRTLAHLLGAAGYETTLFGLQHETREVARLGFEHVGDRTTGSACSRVAPQVSEFLRSRRPADRPFYCRVGFSEVHRPYVPPEGSAPSPDDVRPLPFLEDTPGLRADQSDLYGVVRRTDDAAGATLAGLDAAGLAGNTLVIFTTDHGIAFPRAKGTTYDPGSRRRRRNWPPACSRSWKRRTTRSCPVRSSARRVRRN